MSCLFDSQLFIVLVLKNIIVNCVIAHTCTSTHTPFKFSTSVAFTRNDHVHRIHHAIAMNSVIYLSYWFVFHEWCHRKNTRKHVLSFLDLWCLCVTFSDKCEWGGDCSDACYRFTSVFASVDFVLFKWFYGHPSACQMRSHTTDHTPSWTVVFCSRHVNNSKLQWRSLNETLSFSSSFCLSSFSLSGVPRQHRGEIWKFLSEQYLLRQEVPSAKPPNNDTPYKELLKQLTSQQHAILIDLG